MKAALRSFGVLGPILIAAGAGYWVGRTQVTGHSSPIVAPAASGTVAADRTGSAVSSQVLSSRAPAARDETATRASDKLRVLTDLSRYPMASVTIPFLDPDGKLDVAFKDVFGLSVAEADTLQAAIEDTRLEMGQHSRQNTKVRATDESVVLSIEPFPAGADAYDRLMQRFSDTLGPDRYQAFAKLAATQVQWAFDRFGAEAREITITRTALLDGSSMIRARVITRAMNATSSSSAVFRDVDELVRTYPVLAPYSGQLSRLPVLTSPSKSERAASMP